MEACLPTILISCLYEVYSGDEGVSDQAAAVLNRGKIEQEIHNSSFMNLSDDGGTNSSPEIVPSRWS